MMLAALRSDSHVINDCGGLLSEQFSVFNLSIFNRTCDGDEKGHFTYISFLYLAFTSVFCSITFPTTDVTALVSR